MGVTEVTIKIPTKFTFTPFEYCTSIYRLLSRIVNFQNNLIKNLMNNSFHDIDIITEGNNSASNSFKLLQIYPTNRNSRESINLLTFYISTECLKKSLDGKYSESLCYYSPLQKFNIDFTNYQNLTRETLFKIIMTCESINEISEWDMDKKLVDISSEHPETIINSVFPLLFGFEKGKSDYFTPMESVIDNCIRNFLKSATDSDDEHEEDLQSFMLESSTEPNMIIGSARVEADDDDHHQEPYKQYLSSILDEISDESSNDDESGVDEQNQQKRNGAAALVNKQATSKKRKITVKTILRDDGPTQMVTTGASGHKQQEDNDDNYYSDEFMEEENEAIFMSNPYASLMPSSSNSTPTTTLENNEKQRKPNSNTANTGGQQSLYFSPSNILLDMKLEDSERFEILKQASVLEQTKYQLQKLFIPYDPSNKRASLNNQQLSNNHHVTHHHHHHGRKHQDLVTVLTVPSEEEYEKKKILLRTLRVKHTDKVIDSILNSPHSSAVSSSSSDNEEEDYRGNEIANIVKHARNNKFDSDDDNLSTSTTSEMGSDYIHNLINNGDIEDDDSLASDDYDPEALQQGSISRQNSSQQLVKNTEEARALITAMRKKNIKDLKEFNSIDNWKDYYGGVVAHNLSMIKLDMIKSINEYLELHRQEIGICKVIKVSSTILAIGTSNGTTVIFSNSSSKVAHLKLTKQGKGTPTKNPQPIVNQYNSVTCMDITSTGNYVVCGYEYGDIAFWSIQNGGELIKRINGKGEENVNSNSSEFMTPVDNIQFVKNNPFKVLVSSQGAVKLITLKEKLIKLGGNSYVYDSLRVTDDNFDRVVDVKILAEGEAYHASNDYLVVAMATSMGVFVMALEPFVKILCFLSKPEEVSPTTLPYLSWRKVLAPIQLATSHETTLNQILRLNKTKPPLLAIAWGNILNIFQLEVEPQPKGSVPNDSVNSEMFRVSCMEFKNDLIGALWCGEQVMLLLDREHQLLVVDPFATKNVEERKITFEIPTKATQEKVISTHHLTYHSRFDVKSNDGKFTLHPVPSFHSTLCTRASSVDGVAYLLCDNDMNINNQVVITVKVLSWKERIDQLLDMGSWNHALKMALNFYQGRGIAVIGLPTDSSLRKQLAGDVIGDILQGYVDYYTSQVNTPGDQDEMSDNGIDEYYTELAKTCIRYSIEIEKSDKIFTTFYEIFKGKNKERLFISIIQEYIIKGLLISSESEIVIVPNNFVDKIIQQHLEIYQASNMPALENFLLCLEYNDHLSTDEYANVEFCKQLIEKCIRLRMFKAMVIIYNKGLDDYVTPLKELLTIVFDPNNNSQGDRPACIELVFEYLEKLFIQGTSITNNRISAGLLYDIKLQVLNTIFKANENIRDQFSSSAMPFKSSALSKNFSYKKYYMLSRLLILSAKRFFAWLEKVNNDSSSSSLWYSTEEKEVLAHPLFKPITKQELTNCLIYIFSYLSGIENPFSPWEMKTKKFTIEEEQSPQAHWAPNLEDTVYFSLFLAEQLSKSGKQAIDKNSIFVSVDTLHRIFSTLCYEGNLFDDDIATTQLELVEILTNAHHIIDRDISKELINIEELITSCRNSRFHKVLIYLYSLKGDYEKLLDAYLADKELRGGVFTFINNLTKVESNYTKRGGDVVGAVKLYLEKVDEKLRELCEKCVSEEDRFTKSINLAELQQDYYNSTQQQPNENHDEGLNGPPITDLFYLLKEFDSKYRNYLQIKWEELQQQRKIKLSKVMDPNLEKKQQIDDKDELKAWAQKMVSVVTAFTTSSASETDESTVVQDMTAMIVSPNSLSKGRRRILEVQFYSSSVMGILQSEIYEKFKQLIIEIVNMCKRNIDNGRLSDKEVEKLWFNLLDKLVVPLRELFESYCKSSTDCEQNLKGQAEPTTTSKSSEKAKKRKKHESSDDDSDDGERDALNDSMTFMDGLSDDEDITIEENINDHKEMIASSIREKEKLQEKVRYEFDPVVTKETYEKINRIEKRLVALRNFLADLEYEKKREDERMMREATDPLAPKNLKNRPSNLFLQVCLHHLLKLVFTEMSNSSSSIQDENDDSQSTSIEEKHQREKKFSVFHLLQQAAKNYKKDLYGYFKEPLLDMYDKCGFELMLYHSINRLLESDGFWLHRRRFRRTRRGIRPKSNYCRLCDCSIYDLDEDNTKGGKLKVFYCGHALHEHCLDEINCLNRCPICSKMDTDSAILESDTKKSSHELEKKKSMTGSSLLHNATLEVLDIQKLKSNKNEI
ncbi:hypothetical protein NAEGRDRAFT_58764 [Naegleria gruberi]|uniref:RING-type domain-containing protein n=1 Tax=Naegleria gruberi TaxID=5762 RepID=D2VNL3_NAEGR|nr:uncharacterized protein NAEGRDRAFT_58764 [Naegleria gruberi]EFC41677.1 hypothetical protein NAEGRDRAFT_58764 [Naegleria gruberi]|eukprot:XP_002674421.1 hypothetical protein NAEGRDRAFT_58764 [Naegleria gruberi strain NEG-M]